jgi:cell division protein FtsB
MDDNDDNGNAVAALETYKVQLEQLKEKVTSLEAENKKMVTDLQEHEYKLSLEQMNHIEVHENNIKLFFILIGFGITLILSVVIINHIIHRVEQMRDRDPTVSYGNQTAAYRSALQDRPDIAKHQYYAAVGVAPPYRGST